MAALFGGLDAEAYDRQYDDRQLIRRIVGYFGQYGRKTVIIIISLVLISALGTALPLIVANGVGVMTSESSASLLPVLIGVVFVSGIGIWAVNWLRRRLTSELLQDVVLGMRRDAFAAAARQDLSFYDRFSSGRVVSRITSDTTEFAQVVELATDVVSQMASALILVVILFTIEWRLTLVVLLLAPLVAFTALTFRRLARRATRQSSRVIADVNKSIQEAVSGINVAKNFRQEAQLYGEFSSVNDQAYDINVRRGFLLSSIFPTLNVLSGVATAGLVYFGGLTAVAGVITVSAWYLFVATVDRFWFPIINISAFWSQLQAGLAAVERVFALVDSEAAVVQRDDVAVTELKGDIRFENVDFRYSAQERVLEAFSLHIQPGETIALVGHTGAGKSSIIKLVARFYEFQGGAIFVDDVDIRRFDLHQYRQQLGIVSQVPFLFDGTIIDNIRYGRPSAERAEIEAMARRIGQGDWLETLPEGLESRVGERGSRLSMGQRQLVALVRVLIQRPTIFILDEATASIDPFTESQIQEALDLIMQQTTAIVIAHRLSTVRAADRIIVLESGGIAEEGSHDELMAAGGQYAELYDTYFRHQSVAYIEERGWAEPVDK